MTKLIIQIPCYNEEEFLPVTLADLPDRIPGIDEIEVLVIDDGSADRTAKVAKENGVHHVVSLPAHKGLATAFMAGVDRALSLGANIIVNTDADNQYNAADIEKLVAPILSGDADMVVGARPISDIQHFSPIKKMLQRFGSAVVRFASGTTVPDAPSGFRGLSANAAMELNVFNPHTYTLETLIQAGHKGMTVKSVSVRVNRELRPSRLISSNFSYVMRSISTIVRIFMLYSPMKFFFILGAIPSIAGFLLGIRWLVNVYIIADPGRTYVPSLIVASVLVMLGFQIGILGLVADLMAANRKILEEIRLRMRHNGQNNRHSTSRKSIE